MDYIITLWNSLVSIGGVIQTIAGFFFQIPVFGPILQVIFYIVVAWGLYRYTPLAWIARALWPYISPWVGRALPRVQWPWETGASAPKTIVKEKIVYKKGWTLRGWLLVFFFGAGCALAAEHYTFFQALIEPFLIKTQ